MPLGILRKDTTNVPKNLFWAKNRKYVELQAALLRVQKSGNFSDPCTSIFVQIELRRLTLLVASSRILCHLAVTL
jgi:hypothetical protein